MRMVENGGGGGGAKCFPAGWHVGAKPCDSCKAAVALLYCRKDSAFLCMACDVKLHGHQRHERVWMCEVCEQAPAAVTCKADAAALCVTCDRDIHSANPLARRHERIPVVPFFDCPETVVKSSPVDFMDHPSSGAGSDELNNSVTNDDNYNWGAPTHADIKLFRDTSPADVKSIEMLFAETDNLLDFDFHIPTEAKLQSNFHNSANDSVVPVQMAPAAQIVDCHSPGARYEIDFTRSNVNCYKKNSYPAKSLSHSVSSSSIDVGVVPEGNSLSDISYPFVLQVQANGGVAVNGTVSGSQQPTQLSGMDREARVLRYREKRKNRKFEKTIRYASRKAYAETRPRIKGRFAKRSESVELDVDRWLTAASGDSAINSYSREAEYGVVPSF